MPSVDDVQDISPLVQYTASGGQTVFAYPFPIFENNNLVVYDNDTLQVLTTHYTVSGAGNDTGGNVTFLTGRTAGHIITIYRDVPVQRLTDFSQNGPRRSADMNDELDRLTMYVQQLKRDVNRSIRLLPYDTAGDLTTLPLKADRVGKYTAWDANGQPTASVGTGNDTALRIDLANTGAGTDGSLLTGFRRPEAGAVAMSVHAVLAGWIAVTMFGAVGDGSTNDTPAFQAAINAAKISGGTVYIPKPASTYLITSALNLTNAVGSVSAGVTIRGDGNVNTSVTGFPSTITLRHNGHGFDCTGTLGIIVENLSITTDLVTYPQTCFLLARNTDARSQICRFRNVHVRGRFSKTVIYNYGSEDDQYDACTFWNLATDANTSAMDFTSRNIRNLTSAFTNIAIGLQSTIDHKVFGGEIANEGGQTTSDAIRLDNISSLKVVGPWMMSFAGRALVYVDTTNGPSNLCSFTHITGENQGASSQKYGFYFGDSVATPNSWTIRACTMPNITNSLFAHANVVLNGFEIIGLDNQGQGGGANVAGTLQGDSRCAMIANGITVGALGENNVDLLNKVISRPGEANLTLRDNSAASGRRNFKLRSTGAQVVLSAASDANVPYANAIIGVVDGTTFTSLTFNAGQYNFTAIPGSYANDAAAAVAGVGIGGLYRNGSVVQVRVA